MGRRKDGPKTAPPLFPHPPRRQSPKDSSWPLPWELSQSVKAGRTIASLGTQGLMMGEWAGPVYLTNWEVA